MTVNELACISEEVKLHIFSFLQVKEVIRLGSCSTKLKEASDHHTIWNKLYEKDFDAENKDISSSSKSMYLNRLKDRKCKIETQLERQTNRRRQLENIQQLHTRQVFFLFLNKSFVPILLSLSVFMTCLFIPLNMDEAKGFKNWSIWELLIPIWCFFGVVFFLIGANLFYRMHTHGENRIQEGGGLLHTRALPEMEGCIPAFFNDVHFQLVPMTMGIVIVALFLIFFIAIAIHESSVASNISWFYVFLPFWIASLLTLFSTCCGFTPNEFEAYYAVLFTVLIPFFITSILLYLKLDHVADLSLEVVFIPFWIIEGALILAALFYGFFSSDSEGEAIPMFSFSFPLVMFQAFFCVYYSSKIRIFSAVEVFVPLLILLGGLLLGTVLYACSTFFGWDNDEEEELNRLELQIPPQQQSN